MKYAKTNLTASLLAEVTIAIGVASTCLLGVVGLLPIGLRTNRDANQQLLASHIISAAIADLHATPRHPGATATSPQFAITLPTPPVTSSITSTLFFDDEGRVSNLANAQASCRLTLRFLSNSTLRTILPVHLKVTWPAQADPLNPIGSAEMFLALDQK